MGNASAEACGRGVALGLHGQVLLPGGAMVQVVPNSADTSLRRMSRVHRLSCRIFCTHGWVMVYIAPRRNPGFMCVDVHTYIFFRHWYDQPYLSITRKKRSIRFNAGAIYAMLETICMKILSLSLIHSKQVRSMQCNLSPWGKNTCFISSNYQ